MNFIKKWLGAIDKPPAAKQSSDLAASHAEPTPQPNPGPAPPRLPSAPPPLPSAQTPPRIAMQSAAPDSWKRERAERLYRDGAKIIREGWSARSRDKVADGLEKLQEAMEADAYFIAPWILTLRTLYRGMGRSKLDEMMEMQRLFSAPGEPEKTRVLQGILDSLDETDTFPSFPELDTEFDDERREREAMEAYKAAATLFQSGSNEKADKLLARAIELNPDHVEARIAMTYATTERGDYDQAIVHAKHAAKLRPGYDDATDALFTAYSRKGRHHLQLEQSREAFDCFRLALLASPEHENSLNVFNALWITEDVARDAFIDLCRHLLNLNDGKNHVRLKLGRALMNSRRFGEALPHLEKCYQRDEFNAEAQQWLCAAYVTNRMKQKAREQYELLRTLSAERAAAIAPLMQLVESDDDRIPDFGGGLFGKN